MLQGMTVYVKNVVTPALLNVLKRVAQDVVTAIDSGYIPEYTANLHDATGIAIYNDGAVLRFIPTKRATKYAKSGFGGLAYQIDGSDFLQKTIADASTTFSTGLWFVVFSTVPYAYHINRDGSPLGRGQGFFDTTVKNAVNEVLSGLQPLSGSVSAVDETFAT